MITFETIGKLELATLKEGDLVQVLGEFSEGDVALMTGKVYPALHDSSNRLVTIANGLKVEIFPTPLGDKDVTKKYVNNQDNKIKEQVNNLHTKREAIEWRSGLRVTDGLQLYVHDGVEYLPDSKAVPFTTGATFNADNWILSELMTQMKHWRDVGDVRGWGVDITGVTDSTDKARKAISDGSFNLPDGSKILITDTLLIDILSMRNFNIGFGCEIVLNANTDGIVLLNVNKNTNLNGLKISLAHVGYTRCACSIVGSHVNPSTIKYGCEDVNLGLVSVVYLPTITSQSLRSGMGVTLKVNSTSESSAVMFYKLDVNGIGLNDCFCVSSDGHVDNFMSSCDINVTSWWCKNTVTDLTPASSIGRGISDFKFNIKIQPDQYTEKLIKITNGVGKLANSEFKMHVWDSQYLISKPNLIDAVSSNTYYPSALENADNNIQRFIDYKDSVQLSPFCNIYNSSITDSDFKSYADSYKIDYVVLRGITGDETLQEWMSKVADNVLKAGFTHSFELIHACHDGLYSANTSIKLKPIYSKFGSSNLGVWNIRVDMWNSSVGVITVNQKPDNTNTLSDFEYSITHKIGTSLMVSKAIKLDPLPSELVKNLSARFNIGNGFCVYDTTLSKPLYRNGSRWFDVAGNFVYSD